LIAISIALTAGSTSAGELAARRMRAADRLLRLAQVAGDLLALHHDGAASGERRLLTVLRLQRFEFVGGVAQIIRLSRGALHAGAVGVERLIRGAPRLPQRFDGRDFFLQPGKGVEQLPVRRGVDQRTLVMLAMDLDQRGAYRLQGLYADRLIVDEGAGAAVGELHAAQNHFPGIVEAVRRQDPCRRVVLGDVEGRRHLALLRAVADQARIAAAAKCQREGIEQDGFARAGLAGQHREATGKFDIEPFDQDDVTDRQTRQHAK
jgi:hypothetical protein